ncbi:MAG: DUF72 domain-containing protein [Chloroflexi bacterium]|nr:DUF72 domain-containing protein [Chloroflexota bacterium]
MGILYLGTQGFAYKDWVGNFYPTHSPPADYLGHFVEHFRAVELDSTAHGVPQPATVRAWYDNTPPDFVFAAKFPRRITHDKQLNVDDARAFLAAMQGLREKCGPLLLQFPPDFAPDRAAELDRFLAALPQAFRYVVEFRHAGWNQSHWEMLIRYRVALCLHDLHYPAKAAPMTTNFTYVRWLGNRTQLTKFNRIQIDRSKEQAWWSEVLRAQLSKGQDVYGFVNNCWSGHAPTSAQQLLKSIVGGSK